MLAVKRMLEDLRAPWATAPSAAAAESDEEELEEEE
jgi:hypothetical protein